jgi:periplasmic protein TonB
MRTRHRARILAAICLLAACAKPPDEPIEQPVLMPGPSPFQYPVTLWDRKMTGETIVLVHVTREGSVDSVTVSHPSGHVEFDTAALHGARKLRFVPGKRGDLPVDMWTRLPVRFYLDSTTVSR